MRTHRSQIIELIDQGVIPPDKVDAALVAAQVEPKGADWRTFIDQLLLWLGGLALAFSVLFFIAYNWDGMGRITKFGMVQGIIILAIVAYWLLDEYTTASRVSLMVATLNLGVLLALYHQSYQTGADPWQLFVGWALLMLPWAFIGHFAAIWIVWVVLMNIAIFLYYQAFQNIIWIGFGPKEMLWLIFLFNTIVVVIWESMAIRLHNLSPRWAIRLVAMGSGFSMTWIVMSAIFDPRDAGEFLGLAWAGWLVLLYVGYRHLRFDLFMLTGVCLSVIVVSVTYLGDTLLDDWTPGGFLLLALVVTGMGAGSTFWLKHIHQEAQT